MNKDDPRPRDSRDLALEATAAAEATTALVFALAMTHPNPQRLAQAFEESAAALQAIVQGQFHPERYLDLLEKQLQKRRDVLALLTKKPE